MKKNLLLILTILFITNLSYGQIISELNSGNKQEALSDTIILPNKNPNNPSRNATRLTCCQDDDTQINSVDDPGYISFDVNGSEKMVIKNNGDVGIGATSPTATLDIRGAHYVVTPTTTQTQITGGYMTLSKTSYPFIDFSASPYTYYYDARIILQNNDLLAFTGKSGLEFYFSNNVGIAVWNPTQRLHVNGNMRLTGAFYDKNNDPGTNGQILQTTGSETDWVSPSSINDGDWTISGNDMYSAVSGKVGIGTNSPNSKLNVVNDDYMYTSYFISDGPSGSANYAVYGDAKGSSSTNTGVHGKASTTGTSNYGVVGQGLNATQNFGGAFYATTATGALGVNFAIRGDAVNTGGNECFGIDTKAQNATTNYGTYSFASGGTNAYGIYASATGASTANWAGYFCGDVHATGDITWDSDVMLKDNIQDIDNALDIISNLQPKTFTFKTSYYIPMNLPNGLHYGLIAQDVESILPEVVSEVIHPAKYDSLGNIIYDKIEYKGLNYTAFIPILIQGMKEQQILIDSLATLLSQYCINNNKLMPAEGNSNTKINSKINTNSDNSILYQNNPNPFSEETKINYYLSENVTQSSILIFNMQGTLIKSYNLKTLKGNGKIVINVGELIHGMYIYTLIVNNKEIDTKRMILTD